MSKGNMLLGYARGKVGSLVFSRLAGGQITKAYNGSPRNDRTDSQMIQRSKFICANKLFTRGQQNFFKFAFEDKKRDESDFNAFMRNNIKRATVMSKYGFEEASYPAVGPWLMTKGALPKVNVTATNTNNRFDVVYGSRSGEQGFGAFCTALRANYGVQNGDIITLCIISALGSTDQNTPSAIPETRGLVTWIIKQGICDTNSELSLNDVFDGYLTEGTLQPLTKYVIDTQSVQDCCQAACICISRKLKRGLKVSTTELTLNAMADEAYQSSFNENYIQEVLATWNATPQSVLEGSEVAPKVSEPEFTGFKGVSISDAQGINFTPDFNTIAETAVGEQLTLGVDPSLGNRIAKVKYFCKHPKLVDKNKFAVTGAYDNIYYVYTGKQEINFDNMPESEDEPIRVYYEGNLLFSVGTVAES